MLYIHPDESATWSRLAAGAPDVSTLLWDAQILLAEAGSRISWWYLALPDPHSHTPVDLPHTLGSAGAVLGAALLLTGVPIVTRALSPVAAAGSMALTLYSAHLVLLATGVPHPAGVRGTAARRFARR